MIRDIGINYGDQYTVRKLIEKEKVSGLLLPHFQRSFVWDVEAQTKLICSLLAGVPIGGVLILEGRRSDYAYRILGHNFWDSVPWETKHPGHLFCLFLLDGQQRLSALKTICSDPFSNDSKSLLHQKGIEGISSWEDIVRGTDNKLCNRWFIDLNNNSAEDVFGCQSLEFKDEYRTPADFDLYIKCEKIKITIPSDFSPSCSLKDIRKNAVAQKRIPLWFLMGNEEERKTLDFIISGLASSFREDIRAQGRNIDDTTYSTWQRDIFTFLEKRVCDAIIPDITIEKGDDKLGIGISIFEATNRSGTRLSIYDLISAKMANRDRQKNLSQHIKGVLEGKDWNPNKRGFGLWGEREDMPTLAFQRAFLACLGLECAIRRSRELYTDITKELFFLIDCG